MHLLGVAAHHRAAQVVSVALRATIPRLHASVSSVLCSTNNLEHSPTREQPQQCVAASSCKCAASFMGVLYTASGLLTDSLQPRLAIRINVYVLSTLQLKSKS